MDDAAQPVIVGARVTLRPYSEHDADLVLSVVDDPLIPLITTVPSVRDAEEVRAYIQRQRDRATRGEGLQFVVADTASAIALGQIGIMFRDAAHERASVGYWIAPEYRRRGYVAAALWELSEWALGPGGLERLELYVEPWNEGSWRAAESAGYEREGLLRRWERVGDERRDMYMYSRLRGSRDGSAATAAASLGT